jgi:hypothetical protein
MKNAIIAKNQQLSGPLRTALATVPITALTVVAFYIAAAIGADACSPHAWFCELPGAFFAGLITSLLSSYWLLSSFRVAHPLATSIVAPIVTILGLILAGLARLQWDAPGPVKLIAVVGWMMLAYGATNYLLSGAQKKH